MYIVSRCIGFPGNFVAKSRHRSNRRCRAVRRRDQQHHLDVIAEMGHSFLEDRQVCRSSEIHRSFLIIWIIVSLCFTMSIYCLFIPQGDRHRARDRRNAHGLVSLFFPSLDRVYIAQRFNVTVQSSIDNTACQECIRFPFDKRRVSPYPIFSQRRMKLNIEAVRPSISQILVSESNLLLLA